MDIDYEQTARIPALISYFDVSSNLFAWRGPRPQQIERRRAALGDTLIFDILLASGGIRGADSLYPPTDVASLERLLDAIEASHYDALKKECLVYFLLKWHQDGREEKFQEERCIPPQFSALADAYWHLDTGINITRAVALLSDARLNRDYASKILQAISLSPYSTPLILRYVRTAKPLLTEPDDIDIYTIALAETNLMEAWQFQRTFNEADGTRSRLLKKILEWCLTPTPRPTALSQLIGLPFTSYEQSLLHSYATEPPSSLPPSAHATLQDLICVRLIQSGKYVDAIKIDRQFISSTTGKNSIQNQNRAKMVQDVYKALSYTERTLLDAELELLGQGTLLPTSSGSRAAENDVSMSEVKEVIRALRKPSASMPKSNGTPLYPPSTASVGSISGRSGVPRFGGPVPNNSTRDMIQVPILPISSAGPPPRISGPRKSLPLSSVPLTSSVIPSRPRQSLSHTPGQFLLSAKTASSPAGNLKFSQPSAQLQPVASTHQFNSAVKNQNAFYRPPPAKVNGIKRPLDNGISIAGGVASGANADMNMEVEMSDEHDEESEDVGDEEAEGAGLEFSVFGREADREDDVRAVSEEKPIKATKTRDSRKMPPGAFASDDEDAHNEQPEERTRKSVPAKELSYAQTSSNTSSMPKSRSTRASYGKAKDLELGRSLPGSLMDEEEEAEEEEEEEDVIAPLRSPSPVRRPVRKGRASAATEIAKEEDRAATRRRSSRLSTTSSQPAMSPEPSSPKKVSSKTRKSTAKVSSGTRKKRQA